MTGVEPVDEILTGVRKGKGSRDGFMDWWISGLMEGGWGRTDGLVD